MNVEHMLSLIENHISFENFSPLNFFFLKNCKPSFGIFKTYTRTYFFPKLIHFVKTIFENLFLEKILFRQHFN